MQFKAHKIIYRRYAGLFFALCVDVTDNELAYLESVHLFVEILDHFFNNVCELDLVFNFHKVRLAHISVMYPRRTLMQTGQVSRSITAFRPVAEYLNSSVLELTGVKTPIF